LAKRYFHGPIIGNESIDLDEAQRLIEEDTVKLVSFGRPFIANPDLVNRFKTGSKLAKFNLSTLYTKGEEGYTDYPPMN